MNFHDTLGRTGKLANIDIFLTVLAGLIIARYRNLKGSDILKLLFWVFILAEVAHIVFGAETPVLTFLGIKV